MSLTLYRRHSEDCVAYKLPLAPREKRHYRDCNCPVWLTGTYGDVRWPRQSLDTRDWGVAEAKLRAIQTQTKSNIEHGPTVRECVTRFLDGHVPDVSPATAESYTLTLRRFADFAASKNKMFIRELTADLVEDFKTYGIPTAVKPSSKKTLMTKVKFFLREAYRRGWLTEALAEKMRNVRGGSEQKLPLTDDEVECLLITARAWPPAKTGYLSKPHTFHLLLRLMLETGMRVSDAIRYDPSRCTESKHFWKYEFEIKKSRRIEKPKLGTVYLPAELKLAIDRCEWFSPNLPFAYEAFSETTTRQENMVYNRMQAIGNSCGVEDCRPHRLRDTFAVRMLVRGVTMEDVSELLGHSSIAITQEFYAAWVPSRKDRLERLLSEALVEPGGN